MRAYELQPRAAFDCLTLVERPAPVLGAFDVRVRVRAVSLNFRDLAVARGAAKRSSPVIPVSDGAGEVIEVGSGVSSVKVGQRVAASFFPTWHAGHLSAAHHAQALGGGRDGMLAEEVVLPESAWVPMPAELSFAEAATLPCAGVTAYHALFAHRTLQLGDAIAVQGTGGVSIFALQLAKAAGMRVFLTSKDAGKRERALAMGADQVVDYVAVPKWGEAAYAWNNGQGVDVVVEVGGPATFDQSVAALRYGGMMSILGVLTGTRGEVNTYALFHKALRVQGIYVGTSAMLAELARIVAAAKIRPVIDRVFAFDQAQAAYEHLASGTHFGKVVIELG